MCQLVFVNLGNPNLNRIFLSPLLQIDAGAGNRDGVGFLSLTDELILWKSEMNAADIINLGMILRAHVTSTKPVLAHVRAASTGIEVKRENAHPFKKARFTLAHNGRLYEEGEKVANSKDDTGISSDSLRFLEALESAGKANEKAGIVELLNKAMEKFRGKFAFLIYDSRDNKHFVVRGDTAELHIGKVLEADEKDDKNISQVGYIVNTKKNTLLDAMTIACQVAQAATGKYIIPGEITELKKNTIYEAKKDGLVELGELKEKIAYSVSYVEPVSRASSGSGTGHVNLTLNIWKISDKVNDFMREHFLTVRDMDLIFQLFLGVGMGDLTEELLNIFVSDVIPLISAPRKIRERISSIIKPNGKIYPGHYTAAGVQYPWMLVASDGKAMDKLCKELKRKD